jgi:hypothetical protein
VAIREATGTVATFSLIDLISQYLAFGNFGRDDTYFWLEDRNYFLATYEFIEMMKWVIDRCFELGFSLIHKSILKVSNEISLFPSGCAMCMQLFFTLRTSNAGAPASNPI